jgi:hypothetical protein
VNHAGQDPRQAPFDELRANGGGGLVALAHGEPVATTAYGELVAIPAHGQLVVITYYRSW